LPVPTDSNFEALEKQLAKDALEKALKDLHGKISSEIERNKKTFSDEVKKSLSSFTESLEQHISQEIDKKLPLFLEKNFSDISTQVKASFEQMFVPVLDKTEEGMKRLNAQGENTLHSWEKMMKQYSGLWNMPFFIVLGASVLTGTAICLGLFFLKSSYSTYLFMDVRARKDYENEVRWVELKEAARAEREQEKAASLPKNKNKKKQK
jgi:hypothetical protein